MELEELFCKLFPDYAVNGKPLSPYFDLFQSGYEQAEERLKCCDNCKSLQRKAFGTECADDYETSKNCRLHNFSNWEERG